MRHAYLRQEGYLETRGTRHSWTSFIHIVTSRQNNLKQRCDSFLINQRSNRDLNQWFARCKMKIILESWWNHRFWKLKFHLENFHEFLARFNFVRGQTHWLNILEKKGKKFYERQNNTQGYQHGSFSALCRPTYRLSHPFIGAKNSFIVKFTLTCVIGTLFIRDIGPGQTIKHCLPNIWDLLYKQCLTVWPHHKTLLHKQNSLNNVLENYKNILCLY